MLFKVRARVLLDPLITVTRKLVDLRLTNEHSGLTVKFPRTLESGLVKRGERQ